MNMGWGGKQRKIRSSTLTANDVGTLTHARTIKVESLQLMVFSANDDPPIFDPTAPKYDQPALGEDVMRTYQINHSKANTGICQEGERSCIYYCRT